MPGATAFPTALDTWTEPDAGAGDALNTPGVVHDVVHGEEMKAIKAIEAKVGVDSSAVATSHDYKIAQLTTVAVVQRPRIVGMSGSLVGAAPPTVVSTQYVQQAGFVSVTTDGNAAFNVAFPTAFASGVVSVLMTGDSSNGLISLITYQPNCTLSVFHAIAIGAGGALLINTTIKFGWAAIGW